MSCPKCGSDLDDAATVCRNCNPSRGSAAPPASVLKATVRATSHDALAAFKTLARDPVGGLARAYEQLGAPKALRAGIAFGIVSLGCFLIGGYLLLPDFIRADMYEFLGAGGVVKCVLFGSVPFLCAAASSGVVRRVFGGQGGLGSDCFIAGAALLPLAFCVLVSGGVGAANFDLIGILTVSAVCWGTLMLFAGYTRIAKLDERAGALSVPIVLLLTIWLAKVIAASVLGGPGPTPGPSNLPW